MCVYTGILFPLKKNKIMSYAGKWMVPEYQQNKSDTERYISHVFFHVWKLKIKDLKVEEGLLGKRKREGKQKTGEEQERIVGRIDMTNAQHMYENDTLKSINLYDVNNYNF